MHSPAMGDFPFQPPCPGCSCCSLAKVGVGEEWEWSMLGAGSAQPQNKGPCVGKAL